MRKLIDMAKTFTAAFLHQLSRESNDVDMIRFPIAFQSLGMLVSPNVSAPFP